MSQDYQSAFSSFLSCAPQPQETVPTSGDSSSLTSEKMKVTEESNSHDSESQTSQRSAQHAHPVDLTVKNTVKPDGNIESSSSVTSEKVEDKPSKAASDEAEATPVSDATQFSPPKFTESCSRSIGSKLDQIAQKLMGGLAREGYCPESDHHVVETHILPQDEAAVQSDGTNESHRQPPSERPFSVLMPPNDDSQPDFVEELVSDNLPLDFGEALDENYSDTHSANDQSEILLLPLHSEDSSEPNMDEVNTEPEPSSVLEGEVKSEEHMKSDATSEVTSEVTGEVTLEVMSEVVGEVSSEVIGEVNSEVMSEVTGEVNSEVIGEINSEMMSEVTGKVNSEVTSEVMGEVNSEVMSEVMGEVKDIPLEAVEGQQESDDQHKVSAQQVFEYQWPAERGGDIFMLQEHVSEYLGVLSFKRKYPDLIRRPVEYKERIYLMDKCAVTETQCDLGLTALRSEEVYDLMSKDYPNKYKDYIEALRERERKRITEENKSYSMQNIEKAKMDFFMKKAVRSAAEFNAQFMRERREERKAYFDLQTFEVQFPRSKYKALPKEMTKVGAYPVALIPGQYQDYCKSYTPQELKYFPLNTALYSPHRALTSIYADPNAEDEDKDTADEDKDDSSSSGDSQSGSSDSEPDSIENETVKISEEQIKKLLATPRPDTPPKKGRRKAAQNGADTGDSEKDSESGSTKGRPRKTPGRKTPGKLQRKAMVKSVSETPGDTTVTTEQSRANQQKCSICQEVDVQGELEEFIQCSECNKQSHPSCAELTVEMIPIIKTYPWQCMECKACVKCQAAHDEETMMFCDLCDRGYHTYCVGLKSIPPGRWECPSCLPEGPTPKKKMKQK